MQLNGKTQKKIRNIINYILFMGPAVGLFVVIGLVPFFFEIWYSFTNWDGINAEYQFVGLLNYIEVFTDDPKYWHSMWFTIKFAFWVLIFSNVLGFIWAYGLSKAIPFRNFMRAGFYIPRIVGGVVLGFLWRFIITELFPVIGEATGLGWFSQSWFQTESSSFWAMVIVMTWSMAGYMMIIYVAGLTSISQDYVEAAKSYGASNARIIFRYVLPNAMGPIIVNTTMSISDMMLSAAGLSFIGMGIQPPSPEWGGLLSNAQIYLFSAPHMLLFPGLCILFSSLAFNLVGDGLTDALDPKLKD